MERPLAYLQQRSTDDWLIGYESHQFNQLTGQLFQQFSELSTGRTPPKILLAEPHPLRFLAAFVAAVAANCPIFLCNPNWVQQEWQQVFELVQPNLIFGEAANSFFSLSCSPPFPVLSYNLGLIMIPTGGSSGKIRFAIHTWETLMASVRGFYHYFGNESVNSFCTLPVYHVSGLMQFMRSFTTGGKLVIQPFKQVESGKFFDINPTDFFISLVPTQLQRCLQNTQITRWLSQFKTVLLGGAPAWASLLEQARYHNIPLAPTYGMTETASQVVTLKPDDFLAGNNSCGQVLPHAQVTIRSFTDEILGTHQTGMITIESESLALGYYPEIQGRDGNSLPKSKIQRIKSDDLGFFDEQGNLNIVGRSSQKIITGGENVFPSEVEAAIQSTQLVTDICVIGIPDTRWGQVVTAIYVPHTKTPPTPGLQAAVEDKLSKYKRPKHWISVDQLPRNAQGKVNYEQLQKIAMTCLDKQQS